MKSFVTLILLIGIFIAGCCPTNCNAQAAQKIVTVDLSTLSPDVQAAIQAQKESDAFTQKIETYGKWAGMGKEVGVAVRDGLTAVKDVTLEISETKLGRTVVWLVVWKVAGKDFVQIGVGFIVFLVASVFIVRSYFRLFRTKRLASKSGFFLWPKKTYEPFEYEWGSDANRAGAQVMHALVWLASVGISCAIMFS